MWKKDTQYTQRSELVYQGQQLESACSHRGLLCRFALETDKADSSV